jgi:hypothetical protein
VVIGIRNFGEVGQTIGKDCQLALVLHDVIPLQVNWPRQHGPRWSDAPVALNVYGITLQSNIVVTFFFFFFFWWSEIQDDN